MEVSKTMSNIKVVKEPLIRFTKRTDISRTKTILIRAAAVVLSLIVAAIVIVCVTGLNPLEVYVSMFEGAFSSTRRIWITFRDTMVLLCIAIALAPAFKMKFWNIGAEGQMLVGGIVTAGIMIYFGNSLPMPVLMPLMLISSLVVGALWGLLPAVFKAYWNTNETLFTLMMNYVAIQLTSFFVAQWENPFGSNTVGIINANTQGGWFPAIFGQTYVLNVIIVVLIMIGMYIYLGNTKQGYEVAVVGESENTARYAGINVKWVVIRTMLISGALCGLAGFIGVAGVDHTISTGTAGGRGFTAIIVAWMSKFNTYTMFIVSFFLVFLDQGAKEIASSFNLNEYASEVVTGIILFFLLGCEFFINYKVILRNKSKEEA